MDLINVATPMSKISTVPHAETMNTQPAGMFLASEYHFKPDGEELVSVRLTEILSKLDLSMNVAFQWNHANQGFHVLCGRRDVQRVARAFVQVMHGVIREAFAIRRNSDEENEDYDDDDYDANASLNSKLIERLEFWKTQANLVAFAPTTYTVAVSGAQVEDGADSQMDPYPEELKGIESRHTWFCSAPVEEMLSDKHIAELCDLTSCELQKDAHINAVHIGSHADHAVQLAVKKLEVILKYYWILQGTLTDHFFYHEDLENVKYVLKYFKDIRKFYFESTLLDNLHVAFIGDSDYEKLINSITVRVAPYDPIRLSWSPFRKLNIVPISPDSMSAGAFTAAFTFCGKGDPADDPMRHFPPEIINMLPVHHLEVQSMEQELAIHLPLQNDPEPSAKAEGVRNWAQQLPMASAAPAGHVSPPRHSQPSKSGTNFVDSEEQSTGEARPTWDLYSVYKSEKVSKGRHSGTVRKQSRNAVKDTHSGTVRKQSLNAVQARLSRMDGDIGVAQWRSYEDNLAVSTPPTPQKQTPSALPGLQQSTQPAASLRAHAANAQRTPSMPPGFEQSIQPLTALKAQVASAQSGLSFSPGIPVPSLLTSLDRAQTSGLWETLVPTPVHGTNGTAAINQSLPSSARLSENTRDLLYNLMDNNHPTHPRNQQPAQDLLAQQHGAPAYSQLALEAQANPGPQLNPSSPGPANAYLTGNVRHGMHLLDDDLSIADISDFPLITPTNSSLASGGQGQARDEKLVRNVSDPKFHNTMNQKAPKPKETPLAARLQGPDVPESPTKSDTGSCPDLTPEFEEHLNESFQELLRGIQGYRGDITVQVEFGRIITRFWHKKYVCDEGHEFYHTAEHLHNLLLSPTEYGPKVFFTDVLTMVPAEIHYLLSLKTSGGQDLWESKVAEWGVTYEFIFVDSQDPENPFMIEIDAESFDIRIMSRRSIANLYVHGTKRHWDFRLTAICRGNPRDLADMYGELAMAIRSSLYIPLELDRPNLAWQLDESFLDRFRLEDLSVHRVCHHNSADNKSVLKLAEFRSLDVDGGIPEGKHFQVFKASPGLECDPVEKLNTWYTASISNPELDSLLEQNKSLELGDEAGWTLNAIANLNAAKSMYMPAIVMLKEMDGVGQSSHNGSDFRSRFPGTRAVEPEVKPEREADVNWW